MNNLEYLNEISKSNRPTSPSKKSPVNFGLIFKILLGATIITALLMALVVLVNNGATRATDLTQQLYMRMTNVNKTISTYNGSLKSSQLRSINYSLSGTITGASAQLATYLSDTSESKSPLTPPSTIVTSETKLNDNINATLDRAKLNGTLDRIYSAQIQMQVSLMMSITSEILARDKSPALAEILNSFYSNLHVISETLNNYTTK